MSVRAATFCLWALALASCETELLRAPPPQFCPATSVPPKVFVRIGPDVSASVLCGSDTQVPVASLSSLGSGTINWNAAFEGEARFFFLPQSSGVVCAQFGTTVVVVGVKPPTQLPPGAALDATVLVSAEGDPFPPTRVKVHFDVVAPAIDADRDVVEFGTLVADEGASKVLTLINKSPGPVLVELPSEIPPNILIFGGAAVINRGQSRSWSIRLGELAIGDHSLDIVWRAFAPEPELADSSCVATKTVTLHANVVARPDAGSD